MKLVICAEIHWLRSLQNPSQEQGFRRALRCSFIGRTSHTAVNATITLIHTNHSTLCKTFQVNWKIFLKTFSQIIFTALAI